MDSSIAEKLYVAECADRIATRRRIGSDPGDTLFRRPRMETGRHENFTEVKRGHREVVSDWLIRIIVALLAGAAVGLVAQHLTGCYLPILDMIGR
jgi:hypothetical protein